VLILSTAVIVGCKKKAKDGADASSSSLTVHEKIAKEMCDCTADLLPLMEKQKALRASVLKLLRLNTKKSTLRMTLNKLN